MSQVVSNNVALFFSIFDKHTEKQSLVGKCIYTDGHTEDFLFLLSGQMYTEVKQRTRFIHVAS